MMPVSTVYKQGFKKLMTVMESKYTLPNISPSAVHSGGSRWRSSSVMSSTARPPLICGMVACLNHIRSYRTGG